jgi:hypothetical protein
MSHACRIYLHIREDVVYNFYIKYFFHTLCYLLSDKKVEMIFFLPKKKIKEKVEIIFLILQREDFDTCLSEGSCIITVILTEK